MNLLPPSLASAAATLLTDAPAAAGAGQRAVSAALLHALDRTVETAGPAALALPKTTRGGAKTTSRARRTTAGYAKPALSAATAKKATTKKAATTTKSTTTKSTTTKSTGDLAFLSDPKLSVEEKLFRFMQYFAAKYEQRLEAKLKQVAGKQATTAAKSTSSTTKAKAPAKKKSIFAKLFSSKSVQGLLKQVSGPVLAAAATAVGLPVLAPALAKTGPDLVGALTDVVKGIGGGSGSTAKAAATASSGGTQASSSTSSTEELSKADALEIERLQQKQQEMFSLVSNLLRGMHDTKMAVINNVRS